MDAIKKDLPMAMTMAAFTGISWYIGVEINFSLFMLFKRWRGLYFWSYALGSWGVILQPLFIILADFGIWSNLKASVPMIYLTWLIMVVPQSWVLFSRLHLIMQKQRLLRYIGGVLLFTSVAFSVPTMIVGSLAQATTVNASLQHINLLWDRVQLTVFFVQETLLSTLYIYETLKYVRTTSLLNKPPVTHSFTNIDASNNSVFWHLIYMNLLVIMFDIALLGIQHANLFYLQGAFKPCVYGIKLKVEFVVLNRLIKSIQTCNGSIPYNHYQNTESRDATLVSHTPRARELSLDH